jgi:hypothetical protein
MSQNEILWTFCNSETSFQSDEMSFDHAIEFAKQIPAGEREFWFAWQTGWEDWKAVLDVDQFKDHVRNVSKPPPLPPRRHQVEVAPVVEVAAPVAVAAPVPTLVATPAPVVVAKEVDSPPPLYGKLNQEALDALMNPPPTPQPKPVAERRRDETSAEAEKRGQERRRFPRYQIRFRVIIRNEELTFRTFTKDISLGGLSLENPIPERLMESKCQIFIGDVDSQESIRFTLQPTERHDRRYFSFAGVEEAMVTKLNQWINAQVTKAGKRAG